MFTYFLNPWGKSCKLSSSRFLHKNKKQTNKENVQWGQVSYPKLHSWDVTKLGFEPISRSFHSVMLPHQMIGATEGDMNSAECTQQWSFKVFPPLSFLGQVITECQNWRAFIEYVVPSSDFTVRRVYLSSEFLTQKSKENCLRSYGQASVFSKSQLSGVCDTSMSHR